METDSACLLTLVPERRGGADSTNAPIIHIHPRRLVYVFYHEGKQIVHAERVMDTSEIVAAVTNAREYPLPSSGVQGSSDGNRVDTAPPPPLRVPTTLGKAVAMVSVAKSINTCRIRLS